MNTSGNSGTGSIARRAIHGVVWTTVGNYAVQLIGFVSILILRSWLPPSAFGIFDLAMFWYGILSIRTKVGMRYAVLRHRTLDGSLIGTQIGLDAATGLLGVIIAAAIGPRITAYFGYDKAFTGAIMLLVITEAIASIGDTFTLVLERDLQFRTLQTIALSAALAAYTAALLLGWLDIGILSLLATSTTAWIITGAAAYVVCRRRMPHLFELKWRFDVGTARSLLRDGIAAGISGSLLSTIVSQFDNFLNGTYISPTMQGFYGLAFKIANWPSMLISMVLSRVGYSVMAKVHEDKALLTHTIRLTYWVQGLLMVPFMLMLALNSTSIVQVLYPSGKWDASADFIPMLAVASMLNIYAGVGYFLAVARGHRRYTIGSSLLQATLLVVLGSIFVASSGARGTALAVLTAGAVSAAVSLAYTLRVVGRGEIWPLATHGISAAIVTALHLLLVEPPIDGLPPIARLVVGGTLIGACYLVIFLVLGGRRSLENMRYLRSRSTR